MSWSTRPAQLVVEIYANGKTTGKRVTLTEANNWKATVSGLDRNASGKRIQYAGKAVGTPAGYNISVSTDANGNIKLDQQRYNLYEKVATETFQNILYI